MKVSLNWLKQFSPIDLNIDQLVEKIGRQLGSVEAVVDWGQRYQGIIVAKVVQVSDHPNADNCPDLSLVVTEHCTSLWFEGRYQLTGMITTCQIN